ncbi:hypothetical protein C7447_101520 [Tenacibaculum adriaticum]|uniref:Uncharacterized protein n=1 Tax=Tenacibaculum adriaticum TaxID=413713 RepID=A0A5S5DVF4_9FLAO|nr:hypothetical protein [Tenacibaculum adriaticum]TYP99913.1 hypothetical protein C7447_101520 [Tenacibaculum adriaticum]
MKEMNPLEEQAMILNPEGTETLGGGDDNTGGSGTSGDGEGG